MDSDAREARKIYNLYGKDFVEKDEKNKDKKKVSSLVLSYLKNVKGKKILDAGCGAGRECEILAKKGAKVFGIDVSEFMLKIAKKRCKELGVKFFQRDMEKTGFSDESFDFVLAILSVQYKRNIKKVFNEFCRILKNRGKVLIVIPHPIKKMIEYTKNYFERGLHWERHGEIKYFNYYWTLEDYFNAILPFFRIEEMREIGSFEEKNYPHFLLIKAEKI